MSLSALAALTIAAQAQAPSALEPFTASYTVVWKGMNAGTSKLELQRQPDGHYLYSSHSNARGAFRMFFSEEIVQSSVVELDDKGLRPLRYRGDDGSAKTERDVSLDFDWAAGRIGGTAEDKPVDLELPEGVQDPMSIQLALIHDLSMGRKPMSYTMADKDEIKTYEYTLEGPARIKTALGDLDTLIYRSHRAESSKRITRMWHAPSLGFIPVQAERLKDGKREWLMEIRSLDRAK